MMADSVNESAHPPIFTELPPHPFVPSEFAPDSGRCDTCGGGEGAAIHHHVDPLERIARALYGRTPQDNSEPQGVSDDLRHIAFRMEPLGQIEDMMGRIAVAAEEIAGALHRIEDRLSTWDVDGTLDVTLRAVREP